MDYIKVFVCQAKTITNYKKTKIKLMKCCADIYIYIYIYIKQCLGIPYKNSTLTFRNRASYI
jgi:hypothetical protein